MEVSSENLELSVATINEQLEQLKANSEFMSDPVAEIYLGQVQNSLKHVTYDFRVASDSSDYPYILEDRSAYPQVATQRATSRAERLLRLSEGQVPSCEDVLIDQVERQRLQECQDQVLKDIMDDPLRAHDEFVSRRQANGDRASFPEFGYTVKALQYDMAKKPEVLEAIQNSPLLMGLRSEMISTLQATIEEGAYEYAETVNLIEEATAFFDLVARVNDPECPKPYHTARFEYNWHELSVDPDHTIIPTMASVTAFELLKLRGVPIGVIGVSADPIRVDAVIQTPYEFFHHDVDHTRRMHQESRLAIEREGIPARQYAEEATSLIHDRLLPAVDLSKVDEDDIDERDHRIAMRMILFEILHEDAYDATRDTIADAIMRAPMDRTGFERLVDNTVEYFMGPRASTLAHVYRKLAHVFYDLPESRSTSLGTDFVRTRTAIVKAAKSLYRIVSDDPISDENLETVCGQLVSSDEGFTDGFLGSFAHDVKERGVGRRALSMMISRPMPIHAAVRQTRKQEDGQSRRVHSLFGYSLLEYQDPELLEEVVAKDLAEINPDETAIAIGATPYGIGKLYPMVKDLGFYTLGIVSSTAVARGEECENGVDEIVIVKDVEWGGYRYSQSEDGLLSPTTRVFAGASDSIAAYGGGSITAVTIREMIRRGKIVTYRPFEMNHEIADILQAQSGSEARPDYRGAAYKAWQELNSSSSQS